MKQRYSRHRFFAAVEAAKQSAEKAFRLEINILYNAKPVHKKKKKKKIILMLICLRPHSWPWGLPLYVATFGRPLLILT